MRAVDVQFFLFLAVTATLPVFGAVALTGVLLLGAMIWLPELKRIRDRRETPRSLRELLSNDARATAELFGLFGTLSEADDASEPERGFLRTLADIELRLGAASRGAAFDSFLRARFNGARFDHSVVSLLASLGNHALTRVSVFELLVRFASCRGRISHRAEQLLRSAARSLHLNRQLTETLLRDAGLEAHATEHRRSHSRRTYAEFKQQRAERRKTRTGMRSSQALNSELLAAYQLLGCSPQAADSELKTAFRKLAKISHPDLAKGCRERSAEQFRKIRSAYEMIFAVRQAALS